MDQFPKWDYQEYPKILAPDDFWGQVRRTIHGKAVSEDQIAMIVESIKTRLGLTGAAVLLDIGCGNGALSRYLFDSCQQFVGVDASEYLIGVAKKNFERLPDFSFVFNDAITFLEKEDEPSRFTKALCYGAFSFLSEQEAERLLGLLSVRFVNIDTLFLGNVPDKERAEAFHVLDNDFIANMSNHQSQIGVWRSQAELSDLASAHGWNVRFVKMPDSFYSSHYRYDAILTRKTDGS